MDFNQMDFIDMMTAIAAVIVPIAALCFPLDRHKDKHDID